MKKIILLFSVLSIIVITGCKTKKEEIPVPAGMMPLDLTANGLPIIINVPDSTKGALNVVTQSWGATEIRVGKGFQISIAEGDGDVSLKKSDISSDEVDKFKRYLTDEPSAILWESQITEPELHFYAIVKVGEKSYVIEDIRDNIFGEEDAQMMFTSARSIKGKGE